MAFATEEDLAAWCQRDIDSATAAVFLDMATAEIQGYTGQQMLLVEDDEVTLSGNWTRELWLPQWPVVDVTSVSIDGTALDAAGYEWKRNGLLLRPSSAVNESTFAVQPCGIWGGDADVQIIYSHGVDPIPSWVASICLQVAARAIDNPASKLSEQEALAEGYSYSASYDRRAAGVSLLPDEERRLNRWKRRTA